MPAILFIVWNYQHIHMAVEEVKKECREAGKFRIDVIDVQTLNRTNVLPDVSVYDAIVVNQMGKGDWENELVSKAGDKLIVAFKSGIDNYSNVSRKDYETLARYLAYDGLENLKNFVKFCMKYFDRGINTEEPKPMPWNGIYHPEGGLFQSVEDYLEWYLNKYPFQKLVGLLFYRARYLFRNTAHVDSLIRELEKHNIGVIPVFCLTFPDPSVGMPGVEDAIERYFFIENKPIISLLLWGLYFRVSRKPELLRRLNVPVLNAIEIYANSPEEWAENQQGLNIATISMAVAMPEFDGVINPTVFSAEIRTPTILKAVPISERIKRIAEQVERWLKLRDKPNSEKKIAIVLHSSTIGNSEANIGTALGLDSFESVVEILRAMNERGYAVENIPSNGEELARLFVESKQIWQGNWSLNTSYAFLVEKKTYEQWFEELPEKVRISMLEEWGDYDDIPIPGLLFGNVFVTIQPHRTPVFEPEDCHKLIHNPTLPVPHYYYAFYRFINEFFDAVIHVGKHGSVEWLPGKSVGLSDACFPDVCLRSIPNAYIYIVNNPAEGTQAKRRGYATIIDHLPPPMQSSQRYVELETAVEEYLKARERGLEEQCKEAKRRIVELAARHNFNIAEENFDDEILQLHSKLAELNDSLYNYGLHTFGRLDGDIDDFIASIVRPERFILEKLGVDYSEATNNPSKLYNGYTLGELVRMSRSAFVAIAREDGVCRSSPDVPEFLLRAVLDARDVMKLWEDVRTRLESIQEIENLLECLEGKFIEPAASGDVTRGRIEAIPTGFNFYSVDPKAIPSKTAWEVGKKLADQLIQKFAEEGKMPESIAFVQWSSDPMNTDGEQIAEILYLLGVEPVWDGSRVSGLRVIPLEELKRPRIDVVVRISGLFRDVFMNLVELIDDAVMKVATLDEPLEMNYVRKHFLEGIKHRIFGDMPGAYGAGVNHAINTSYWEKEEELAEIFMNWGCYVYGKNSYGERNEEELKACLKTVEAVVRNHYTDEWDIFDDDCPYAFQGGMALAVKHVSGRDVKVLIGDTRKPEAAKVVDARDEIERVARKTLLNEKWLEGMKKHGYKGAGDIMKRVVNLFGWQATTKLVDDWIFDRIAEKYVLDDAVREWFMKVNPHAAEEIARRLLEAYRRNLWSASDKVIEELEEIYGEIEGHLEDIEV
ncbi:cobaltochelatase subunit CobN [Archaeoglobus veneficus]|uniref:Cobaltochelatase n=1 Tax=Archaeoglobus veneficus (strain DSM 11195 / SNP6) TaxID=693661 RepID=F2KQ46_ARCVS|nr:cobaltochelatase subunit CobN [Archaeoglobus veneficus]AEA47649.1 Cobaltochelatase [Archaeoglobus veneficus SNP6]